MTFVKFIKSILLATLCLTTITLTAAQKEISNPDFKVVGYYTNWSVHRSPSFKPHQIDPELLTHINYAFAKVDKEGNIVLTDPYADIDYRGCWTPPKLPYHGNFRELYDLKKNNPHLKTLISLGSWTLEESFSKIAESPTARQNLAKNIVEFCKTYDFDGVDIAWEYPGFGQSPTSIDKKNFTLLLEEIYKSAKSASPALLVSVAAPANSWYYQNIEVENIHHYVDWINLLAFDFHGPWKDSNNLVTNHNAARFATKQGNETLNVHSAISYYLEKGTPKEKLILGIPLYGRSYSGANSLYSPYKGIGRSTSFEKGIVFYSDIKMNLLPTFNYSWDEHAQAAYIYNDNEFISFDDKTAIAGKCHMIKEYGLGGAMVWELGFDSASSWDALTKIHKSLTK